jgi:hypothetical protein
VQVSPRGDWREPVNIYSVTALAPGQRKTPLFQEALRPVRTIERQRMSAWQAQREFSAVSGAIFDKRRKEVIEKFAECEQPRPEELRRKVEGLGAGLDLEVSAQPRLLTEDVTPEGLAALLAAHGRVIAASDEGAAIFENLAGRYARGSTSWDVFNKAHSAADLVVDRKGSDAVIVWEPAVDARDGDAARRPTRPPGEARRRGARRPRPASLCPPGARVRRQEDAAGEAPWSAPGSSAASVRSTRTCRRS